MLHSLSAGRNLSQLKLTRRPPGSCLCLRRKQAALGECFQEGQPLREWPGTPRLQLALHHRAWLSVTESMTCLKSQVGGQRKLLARSHNQTGALRGLRCLAEIKATAQVEVDLGS